MAAQRGGVCRLCLVVRWWAWVSGKQDEHAGDLAHARSLACGYAANVRLLLKERSAGMENKKITSTPNRAGSSAGS
ncbi:hypothetical protein DFH07DRAFT_818895 [Mycena maculata]|uniref:Secreted protein n=1 Tax=Mycena maculata TaxID=230809 RepID=A0AAD7NF61_9AGAR|nr:hypothetical protein DFH07DRAFT_818895 [Mycena maculata]